jgi:hypothetical protein
MNDTLRIADPLEHLLACYERGITPTQFDILNAKDQLRKVREQVDSLISCYQNTRVIAREDRARWLSAEQDRAKLSEENALLKESLNNAVAFARINSCGDLYDLRLQHNPHVDQTTVLPLYSNKEEFKRLTESLKKT